MKKLTGLLGLILLVCLMALTMANCNKQGAQNQPASTTAQETTGTTAGTTDTMAARQDLIKRGQYLVIFGGCNDCHSPKVMVNNMPMPDTTKLLSGHPASMTMPAMGPKCLSPQGWFYASSADMTAWQGPWGISYAANLTPDQATGTGSWDENMFIQTLRNGKHMGSGRDLLPPMPWQEIGQANDNDLRAIFAYIHSLPPISNQVPQPIPPKGGPGGAPAGGAPGGGAGSTGTGGGR